MASVAVIGASNDRSKYANKAVRAFLQRGYTVFPIHPAETIVEDLPVYKSVLELPTRPDIISVYVRPKVLVTILPDIAAKGCDELWLNPGTESEQVLDLASHYKLNVVQACSIIGLGVSPTAF